LNLPKGHNRYGLEDDGCWLHDPFNPAIETNEYGELNSVVEITQWLLNAEWWMRNGWTIPVSR